MALYRKGFTLVEILVVVAIIGIFAASTMYFTKDARIDQTKAERLANSIHDSVKNARNNMLIGRGVYSGSALYPTDRRTITIAGGGIKTDYAINGTLTGTETNVNYPFFDNDPRYRITDISVSSGVLSNGQKINWDHTGVLTTDITIEPNGSMTIRALKVGMIPVTEPINTVRVTAGYGNFTQSVMLDRLVGRSEVVQDQGDELFSSDPACDVLPSCAGLGSCTTTIGIPSMVDQPWVHAAPSCGFTCNTNYNWNGISCVAATQTANCTSTPPPNATASTPTTFTQTWNGSTWLPVPTGWTHGASTCGFNCNTNYNWNGSTTCNPATDTFACTVTSLPPNAVPSSTMYTRTWNGTIFAPATMNYGYAATNCGFTCATNYNWNSGTSTCDAASNTFNCAAKPAVGTVWNTVPSYTQTWNGSIWIPANSVTAYNATPSTTACRYRCALNYTWNIGTSTCDPDTRSWTCGGTFPANATATTPTTYTQTWNGSAWAPTTNWAPAPVGTCGFTCNGGYTWNGSACVGIINGACNPTFNSLTAPTPTCASGNPTGISGTGPWTWGCNSPNGGTSTAVNACSANKRVDCVEGWGACVLGSRNNIITTPPANGGTACVNPATSICGTAGVCGTANGASYPSVPVSGLCAQGNPSTVTGTGPWNWNCNSVDGGTNASCSANLTTNSCNPTLPVCAGSNCNVIYSPSSVNQTWVKNAPSCGFSCNYPWYGSWCLDRNCMYNTYNGSCNVTCGGGNYYRYYNVSTSAAGAGTCSVSHGGYAGLGASCYAGPCPIPAWTSETSCSLGNKVVTCTEQTGGHSTTCAVLGYSPGANNRTCGTNGGWSGYGSCSGSCGPGNGTQTRTCTNPAPSGGGAPCSGSSTQSCTASACPTSGPYSYGAWGTCTGLCGAGNGTQSRSQFCTFDSCHSPQPTTQSCTASACVNGVCNNATPLGCSVGSPIFDNGNTSCLTWRTWNCQGPNGGGTSSQCSYKNFSGCGSWGSSATTCNPPMPTCNTSDHSDPCVKGTNCKDNDYWNSSMGCTVYTVYTCW